MLVNLIRTIVLYLLVLLVMRLMGKREIGQLQPFELVISIMIADLASIPMSDVGVPIFNGIIPILGLLVMHLLISFCNLKSIKFRGVICGKPSILIYRGKIDEKELGSKNLFVFISQFFFMSLMVDSANTLYIHRGVVQTVPIPDPDYFYGRSYSLA